MLLSSASVIQSFGTGRRLRGRRLAVGRPSELTGKMDNLCSSDHLLSAAHIHRHHFHHKLDITRVLCRRGCVAACSYLRTFVVR